MSERHADVDFLGSVLRWLGTSILPRCRPPTWSTSSLRSSG
ncbi:hypothetical protein [Nocardioides aequoreus]|nr:hypothetical protein [Nocardioides aequoreus]